MPYLWLEDFYFSLSSFFDYSVSCEKINEFSENGDDCVEVEDEGRADERNSVCEEGDLSFSLRADVSISDGRRCHYELIKQDLVFRKISLFIIKSHDFIAKND